MFDKSINPDHHSTMSRQKPSIGNLGQIFYGLLLVGALILSVTALAARSFSIIGWLAIINLIQVILLRIPFPLLRSVFRWFLTQTVVITGLYLIRFGVENGLPTGLRISCQILLGFLPVITAMNVIPHNRLIRLFSKIMPFRTAFVLTTSMRFIPLLKQEFIQIYEAQKFRGARITGKDLLKPANWNDVIHCLLVPFIVQGYKITENAAIAAKIRNFDAHGNRTFWNRETRSKTPF